MSFTCEYCHKDFEVRDDWSEVDREAEMLLTFSGSIPESERATVCDDCYNYLITRAKADGLL